MIETYIRQPNQDDLGFIYNSWLKSFRQTVPSIDKPIYFIEQRKIIDKIFDRSKIYISCNPEHLDQIFGYVIFDESPRKFTIVHYVYVKHPYRRLGIGDELMNLIDKKPVPFVGSHTSRCFDFIKDKWDIVFNPYILTYMERL